MKHPLVLVALATLMAACNSRPAAPAADAGAAAADSDSTAAPVPLEQLTLPDTSYASVQAVDYSTDHDDTLAAPLRDYDDRYQQTPGAFAFRKNLLRDADFGGTVSGTPTNIEVAWQFDTAYDGEPTDWGTWGGGSGWSGQPVYVKWPADVAAQFRQKSPALTADFSGEEIIVGSLCGKVYFIDYQSGKPSRTPIDAGNTVKGSTSLDPELLNLYVGQGVHRHNQFGCMAIDLLRHERTFFQDRDPRAWRGWGAFDSSPIVAGGYLFWAGENGSLYKFERTQGRLRRISTLRYRVKGAAPGIESSLCVYRNYGFFGDNRGNILCVNLNTMRPVWHYDNHDDTDGTLVCQVEGQTPFLYTACEVDKQGDQGQCHFVKLNALTGERVWEQLISCNRLLLPGKTLDGGMYCTPLPGKGDCQGLIFANICRNSAAKAQGELTALSTADGSVVYRVPLSAWAWSSPVGFYNEQHQLFIFTGDAVGNVYLIRGKTGEVICKKHVGNNFESSPVVAGNTAVVGSRGTSIFKFVIK